MDNAAFRDDPNTELVDIFNDLGNLIKHVGLKNIEKTVSLILSDNNREHVGQLEITE